MSYGLGLKALRSMVEQADAFTFYKAKYSDQMFVTETEKLAFKYVSNHLNKFQALPKIETLETEFPEMKEVDAPEPPAYYQSKIEERFQYDTLSAATMDAHSLLQAETGFKGEEVRNRLRDALNLLIQQEYRHRIMDLGVEGPKAVMNAYYNLAASTQLPAMFGWPHLDLRGGLGVAEMAAIVGRPGMGKTYLLLHSAQHNWQNGRNVMFVTTEMANLAIAQRQCAMYAHTMVDQLKMGGYATKSFTKFKAGMKAMGQEEKKMYILDGNRGLYVEDIYTLAYQLKCDLVCVDGAYLVRHPNKRLNKYDRIAENAELMKQYTADSGIPTIGTWQLNREAAKKDAKKGERVTLDNIGGSDVIGQICSVVLALLEEDGVETMISRLVDLLKGRNGETGQFRVNWDFILMNFTQMGLKPQASEELQDI